MSITPSFDDTHRLPTSVKPNHYDLTVKTDLEKLEFEGFVKISLDVLRETSLISFNSSFHQIETISLSSDSLKDEQDLSGASLNTPSERVTYQLPTALPTGSKVELRISFSGKLSGNMTGYYKSSYVGLDGNQNYCALTHFEPTAARRAFPCWDEPLLKSTFAITLISRENTINLSNMNVIAEDIYSEDATPSEGVSRKLATLPPSLRCNPEGKWKITTFATTPPMSTYIVAYANGHFKHLETLVVMPLSSKTIPLRIYVTAENIHMAQFSLDVLASVLPLYEKIFDIEYPLPKLDLLAASDFPIGAMENWGLITGRTSIMLLDPKNHDIRTKKNVASTVSHEVAHMWFGNITTMEWWNNLYLKEGFATLMGENIIADKVFPEWRVDSSFLSDHLNTALDLDAKLSSHPVEVDCPDADYIRQIFDDLSYSKAASVLRMLSKYVGEELFLKGVSIYLKNKLYRNSVTKDLWDGVTAATGIDVATLMNNWITKIGFPVLTVTETATGIHVRQDRFLETGHANPEDNETIWNVPLSIITIDNDGNICYNNSVLSNREGTFDLDVSKPFKLNGGTPGVYRVFYTPERLAKIADEASKPEGQSLFSLNDRIGIVHDAMALSKAGLAKLSSALTLVEKLKNEKEYLVWSGIANNLAVLGSVWWEHPELVDRLNAFRRELFVPLVQHLGYEYLEGEPTDLSLLRTCAITQAAGAKDKGVVRELRDRFMHFMETGDSSRIPADLQRIIYAVAVRHGGRAEYDATVRVYEKPRTPSSGVAAMLALGGTEDPLLIEETFKIIKNRSRDQDVSYFFAGLAYNNRGRRPLVRFFKEQYQVLLNRFEGNLVFGHLVEYAIASFSTDQDYLEAVEFFKDKDTSTYHLYLAQALEEIHANAEYIKRSSNDMKEWFEGRQ